jgi:hypothetical protein
MIPSVLRTSLFHIHDLLATYHAVMVVFCTVIAYFSFFPHDFGYSRFQTMAIAEAMATVTATIGYDSQNKQMSRSSVTGLQLTEPQQH